MKKPALKNRISSVLILSVLTGFIILISCRSSEGDKKPVDLSAHWLKEENFPLSEMARSISYIPLETKEECFIPNAYECSVKATENHIFVAPRSKPLMIFDRKGKFIGKAGSIGEGPGEIHSISSYIVNEKNQWLSIFNPNHSTVLVFSIYGRLIREFAVDKSIVRLIGDPDGNMIGLSIDIQEERIGDSRMIYLSPEGREIRRVDMYRNPDLKSRLSMTDVLRIRWKKDGAFTVYESPFDKIYDRDKKGNWTVVPGFLSGEMANIQQISETPRFYFIQATNPRLHYFVVSKETGTVTGCSFLIEAQGPDICGVYNDLDGGLPFWPKSQILEDELVSMFDAPTIIDCAKGKLETYGGVAPKVHASFREMSARLTYEDNPVVAIVDLK